MAALVSCDKRFRVEQHRTTAKHRKCSGSDKDSTSMSTKTGENTKKTYKQTFMPKTNKDFKAQLVEAFLSADIPLKKIRNPLIVFTDLVQAVPSETMCREHVRELAESEQGRIKELLMDKKVFLVVDESEIDKKKYSRLHLSRIPWAHVILSDLSNIRVRRSMPIIY